MSEILEIECPTCGETVNVHMNEFVDVSDNPELKIKVIEGDYFLNTCPNCGDSMMVEYPIMYMDPDRGLNFYMAPDHEEELLDQLNSLDVPGMDEEEGKTFRLVDCGLHLMEKILIAEGKRDDRVIELMKFIMWEGIKEEWPDLEPGDLLYMNEGEGEFFVIWSSDNGDGEKLTVPLDTELYDELSDRFMEQMAIPPNKYAEVDQFWIDERFEK